MIKKYVSALILLSLFVSFIPAPASAFVSLVTPAPANAALFSNPWTIGIGAGIAITTAWLKSQARWEANTFVQDFQNPFHAKLAAIVDAENAAYNAGQLPLSDANKAWDDTHILWAEFLRQGDNFAKDGSDEARVWGQAKNQLGPIMIQIFADMEIKIRALGGVVTPWQASTSDPQTSSTVSNKFDMSDSVRVSGTVLNIRETPSRTGSRLGRQYNASTGQIIGGPIVQG